jgi:hypothetical protein
MSSMLDIERELSKILSDELAKSINSDILKTMLNKTYLRSNKIRNILKRVAVK